MAKLLTTDIEVGESGLNHLESPSKHNARKQKWWWHMVVGDCEITGVNVSFRSRASAVRSAHGHASRFGIRVLSVYTYGQEPQNEG